MENKKATRELNGFYLTIECNNFIDAVLAGDDVIGEAFAGTGKSTSLLAVEKYHTNKKGLYICYGKTLEEEARELFAGDNVKISTSHALALSYLPNNLRDSVLARTNMNLNTEAVLNYSGFKGNVNAQMFVKIPMGTVAKCINIISKQFIETASEKVSEIHLNKEFIATLKSLEKQKKLDEKNLVVFKELMLECASKLTTEMMDLNSSCPTTHDGYLKSWQLSNPVLDYDYILFDEAQDSNPVLLHIVLSQQCQKILVADSYQNIFQFRGSLNVIKIISFDKYPLTHSFRYGQDLADLASKVLNHIDNKISITGRGYDTQIIKGSECEHSEPFLFIANTNFSTYEVLADCYQNNVPAKILGDTKVKNAQSVLSSLISFKQNGLATHNSHKKYKSFADLLERNNKGGELSKLAEMVNSNIEYAEDLLKAFEWSKSFSNDQIVVTLITAHLSKGLEADNVFIADDFHSVIDAFTNGNAIKDSDLFLFYVAITRAKKCLILPDAIHMAMEDNSSFKVTPTETELCQSDNLKHLLQATKKSSLHQVVKSEQTQSELPNSDIVKNEHSSDLIESTPESLMPLDYLDSSVSSSGTEPTLMEQTGDVDLNSIAIEIGVCKETGDKQYWTPTDTNRYLNPNFAVLGTMGTGKTQSVKSLLAQLTNQKRKNTDGLPFGILVFDYKSDYIGDDFVKETGATVLDANAIPINPLTLYSKHKLAPIRTCKGVVTTITKAFNLGINQQNALKKVIMVAYERNGIDNGDPSTFKNPAPTLNDVYKIYNNRDKVPQDSLTAALDEIVDFELFEKNNRKCKNLFDTMRDNLIVVNLSGVDVNLQNLIVATLLDLYYAQMHGGQKPKQSASGHRAITNMFLVDEADNFLSQNYDSLRKLLKEGREYGVGAILSTQGLDHFKTDLNDYSVYMAGYCIHRLENPKASMVASVFNQTDKATQNKTLSKVRELEKHHSLLIDGKKQITYQESTAFWKLIENK